MSDPDVPGTLPFLGQLAYEAYLEASGGRSLVSGVELPAWDAQDPLVQRAWDHAADAVLRWAEEVR